MKLRNKKTGEIRELADGFFCGDNLKKICEEWEDYEEPKEIYFISNNGQIHEEDGHDRYREARKEIGNYFETKEEADKAVEKLKAWKRLKDKGFRFDAVNGCWIEFTLNSANSDEDYEQGQKDLHLLFGGENELRPSN